MLKEKRNLSFHVPAVDYVLITREAARRKVTLQVLLTEMVQERLAELREAEAAPER